ncbi:unnamed protein product [Vitrella brassicaformis CCMP3155]|uniref:Signal peptidase complex subunit 1 n=1 Tax=Vitrella brassicaformis (strain CCMP3155) TaxID=1169540 RepID=A0A0G4GLS1_VITBC|nr:unnamed protein product [Vitrella brassicaformis CCMP3155]|mmetsp:Transcript_14916/g.35579  ORF Transcript_14916/g.35579 Transcript_14916/m.35579 type:complete len:82 (-) Transcript_14916:306-551(-)|eukprot:CEM31030.1 unnamed protein product [Vitrella brassicaformis CCMP3155]
MNTMDFKGQYRASIVQSVLIWTVGLVGFVLGFVNQSFRLTFFCILGATVLSAAVCLPSWPWWNMNPVQWQKPKKQNSSKKA